jgi:hypothetical protein
MKSQQEMINDFLTKKILLDDRLHDLQKEKDELLGV